MKDTEMLQEQITSIEERLMRAINICRGVDGSGELEKTYPYSAGYSQSAMVEAVHELRAMRKYLLEE